MIVRKSLKSPAADTMINLGERATFAEVLHKLLSLYDTVMSGNTLLIYRFYSESQRMHEPCVMLSTIL